MKITLSMMICRNMGNIILLALAISILCSCRKDVMLPTPQPEKEKTSPLTKISYASFLNQVPSQRLGDLANTLSSSAIGKKNLNMSFYGEQVGQLTIETDSVLRMQLGDTLCYVFSIKPQSQRSTIFQNLTLQMVGTKTKAFLTTYYPDRAWIDAWRKKIGIKFNGNIQVNMVNLNIGNATHKTNNKKYYSGHYAGKSDVTSWRV